MNLLKIVDLDMEVVGRDVEASEFVGVGASGPLGEEIQTFFVLQLHEYILFMERWWPDLNGNFSAIGGVLVDLYGLVWDFWGRKIGDNWV